MAKDLAGGALRICIFYPVVFDKAGIKYNAVIQTPLLSSLPGLFFLGFSA